MAASFRTGSSPAVHSRKRSRGTHTGQSLFRCPSNCCSSVRSGPTPLYATTAPRATKGLRMSDTTDRPARLRITTRVASDVHDVIERIARQQRTTPAHVARVLLEDAAREVAASAA